jgi:hypothetical protein
MLPPFSGQTLEAAAFFEALVKFRYAYHSLRTITDEEETFSVISVKAVIMNNNS